MSKLSKELELELVELYKSGSTTKELCLKYNWNLKSRHGPLDILKKYKVNIREDNKTHAFRYSINDKYFEKIDSKDKAYFLGLIYADGSLNFKKSEMRLALQDTDKNILEKFKYYINSNKPLRFRKKPTLKHKDQYIFVIENKKICKDLLNLEVNVKKEENLNFPSLNTLEKEYYSDFIRGFFDGDGCITHTNCHKNKKIYKYPLVSFSGTFNIINSLNIILSKILNTSEKKLYKRHKDRDTNNGYSISYSGINLSTKFYNYIYKNCDDLYINRKKEKFEKLLNMPSIPSNSIDNAS